MGNKHVEKAGRVIQVGIKGFATEVVTEKSTAASMGSGFLAVYATPAMIALMEKSAAMSVQPFLEDGQGTVGTFIEVSHISATPLGMQVQCESELLEVDNRKLVFQIMVSDASGLIGTARHERFVIDNERFMQKADAKNNK